MAQLSRRQFVRTTVTLAAQQALLRPSSLNALATAPYKSFRPGQVWLDTDGKPIQAHGGSIITVKDKFYWYGENKEFTTGKTTIWTWGVRCYESSDLYNWRDLGLIIPPDLKSKDSPLNPEAYLDRPHILYNKFTGKFICWLKLMSKGNTQTRTVLQADVITGPYTILASGIKPVGMDAGDFDLAVSPSDGKAYMYFERVHSELICADLTENYTNFTGFYSTHFPHPGPPSVREGVAHFYRKGKHYLATSGTTGYYPNPSEVAIGETFHGPFTVLGDLHPSDRSRTSFNSQISCVFQHPKKKDLYIALADQWIGPMEGEEFASGEFSTSVQKGFAKRFSGSEIPLTPREAELMARGLDFNTSLARYVWLPFRFEGVRPVIEWTPDWRLEDYS